MNEALGARESRTTDVLTHCLYQIATGKWAPESRLPSVRQGEESWGVDRRTILKAYRRLEEQGLLVCRDRSGFYVAPRDRLGPLSRHRFQLEELHTRFTKTLTSETSLSPLAVFRYFAHLADLEARDRPECAFVECTASQAEGHALEVSQRLGMPCLPITLAELQDGVPIPPHVRVVLVSAFHVAELRSATGDRAVLAVPIEVEPRLFSLLPQDARQGWVLDPDETEARNLLEDVRATGSPLSLAARTAEAGTLDELLPTLLEAGGPPSRALLSPRLFGSAEGRWREHPAVHQIEFRIREEAWDSIATALGMPLGTLG